MDFQFSTDAAKDYGIQHARDQYIAGLTDTVDDGNGNQIPNPEKNITVSDYATKRFADVVASWAHQADLSGVTMPTPSPVVVNGVPQEVSRRQAIQALIDKGYFDKVQPAIDAIADPTQKATMQNEWNNSTTFQRQRASLIALAIAIGITDPAIDPTQLNDLFIYANSLH